MRLPQECGRPLPSSTLTLAGKRLASVPFERAFAARPFGSVCGRASITARWTFISPLRYSVLALLVLTSPLVSTTQPQGIISDTPQVFAGISDTPQVFAGCSRFYPTRKIRDFSRGDPVCARGFATQSVLALLRYFAGTPLCFRKRKMQDVRLLRVFSLCLETIALLADFCSAGWAAPPPVCAHGSRSCTMLRQGDIKCCVFGGCGVRV